MPTKKLSLQQSHLVLIVMAVVALLLTLLFVLWPKSAASINAGKNGIKDLASCLTQKGIVMYGVDTCENCQNQKQIFGPAFAQIKYVNCDFNKICDERGYKYYPVWTDDKKTLLGLQTLPDLAKFSSCELGNP
ncbi:MAG: hypothetical protein WC843_00340 [Candidatus Gracilibacteria bacterium]|jgi:hypothetical protein